MAYGHFCVYPDELKELEPAVLQVRLHTFWSHLLQLVSTTSKRKLITLPVIYTNSTNWTCPGMVSCILKISRSLQVAKIETGCCSLCGSPFPALFSYSPGASLFRLWNWEKQPTH